MACVSSKRSLYHPAPAQTPPPQIKKSLAQGRLVSDSHLFSEERTVPDDWNQNQSQSVVPDQSRSPIAQPPRMATSMRTHPSPPKSPLLIRSLLEDLNHAGPRRISPQQHQGTSRSPQRVKPSSSLSFSGDEDQPDGKETIQPDATTTQHGNDHKNEEMSSASASVPQSIGSPVLMVDASRQHRSPNVAEVPVVTTVVSSPVKVVCHSPRSTRIREQTARISGHTDTTARVTGHTDTATRVDVAGVPTVSLQTSLARKNEPSSHSQSDESSVNGNTIAGSPVDLNSTAIQVPVEELSHENEYKSFMGDQTLHDEYRHDATLGSVSLHQPNFDVSGLSNDASVARSDSSRASALGETIGTKKKNKKSKARFIPSRYMQPSLPKPAAKVEKKQSSSHSMGKPKAPPPTVKKPRAASFHGKNTDSVTPFIGHVTKQEGMVTSTPAVSSGASVPPWQTLPTPILAHPSTAPKTATTKISGKTPRVSSNVKGTKTYVKPGQLASSKGLGLYRSTEPHKKKGKEQGPAQLDSVTSVTKSHEMYAALRENERMKQEVAELQIKLEQMKKEKKLDQPIETQAVVSDGDKCQPLPQAQGPCAGEVSQLQLDLEYARLFQWEFLESKLKHTFSEQEKQAQVQMYAAWQENERMKREVAELQIKLEQMKKEKELDQLIEMQLSGFDPFGERMQDLLRGYAQLAGALDTTRHHMPVSGVVLPDNPEELIAALNESQQLLGEFEALTAHQQPKVSSFAREMEELARVADSEVKQQSSCKELLAAASTLSTQESSLLAHTIQDG